MDPAHHSVGPPSISSDPATNGKSLQEALAPGAATNAAPILVLPATHRDPNGPVGIGGDGRERAGSLEVAKPGENPREAKGLLM